MRVPVADQASTGTFNPGKSVGRELGLLEIDADIVASSGGGGAGAAGR